MEHTTLRLDDTAERQKNPGQRAIRWLYPEASGSYQRLTGAPTVVGRGNEANVRFDAAGVSRRHAEIYREGPVFALRDLGSTNGTYVNGRRVSHAPLSDGDVIRLGDLVGVVCRLSPELESRPDVRELAGGVVVGPGLAAIMGDVERAAPSDLSVVLVGETGVGKECLARAVHIASGRNGAFHGVNCAALPVALAEAELFGHKKGAFTGADDAGLGHLRAADGGTLFLDELAELPAAVQAKLLRALQEKMVTPLGETRSTPIDVRLVTASQQPLAELVASQKMRRDLAMRLNGVELVILPLRNRRIDVAALFDHFLRRHARGRTPRVEARLLEQLLLHDWPGNVRELEQLTRSLLVMHGHEPVLRRNLLPETIAGSKVTSSSTRPASSDETRREHDLQRFASELRRLQGNVTRAASAAGISRQRAYRLMGERSVADFLNALDTAEEPASKR